MLTKEEIKKGKKIFYVRDVFSAVEQGVVESPKIKTDVIGAATSNPQTLEYISIVSWKKRVYIDGETENAWGASGAVLSRCFNTAKQALTYKENLTNNYIKELREEITDLKSLLEFPLNHDVRGGDNPFTAAVYKEAVKKYLEE